MPCMKCAHFNGSLAKANLEFARYSIATWTYWCKHNQAEFVLLEEPLGGEEFRDLPPTFQRWLAFEDLVKRFGPDAVFAFVDADTMIRWDTPSIFDLAGDDLTAVKDWNSPWVHRSIKAFQPFFPDIRLNWWEYFNAGMVILNSRHMELIRALTGFALENKRNLQPLLRAWQGDDQTPFNFLVKRFGFRINFLDPRFNMIHCVPNSQELFALENQGQSVIVPGDTPVDLPPSQLDFIEMGYIWHFTNVVRTKSLVMAKTWSYIRGAYPGVT